MAMKLLEARYMAIGGNHEILLPGLLPVKRATGGIPASSLNPSEFISTGDLKYIP
jgi:hypothetical protein